jgi:putative membrane protein
MMGFGLGFLNFIGTILFFVLLFALLRMFLRGWKYSGMGHGPGSRGWGGPWMARGMGRGWGRHGWGGMMGGWNGRDDALEAARERLAKSEITPEQFETIQKGLETRRQRDDEQPWRGWMGGKDDALETARLRFARGEISAEEFEMIKKALEN